MTKWQILGEVLWLIVSVIILAIGVSLVLMWTAPLVLAGSLMCVGAAIMLMMD